MAHAAPLVGLVLNLDSVTVPVHLRSTMAQTAWDLGTKQKIVPQDHAQVLVHSRHKFVWS